MNDKIDYKTLRFLPRTATILMAALIINMAVTGLLSILSAGCNDSDTARLYDGIISISHILKYVAVIGIFISLYLLAAGSRWIKYSVQMIIAFVFAELAQSIANWLVYLSNESQVMTVIRDMIQLLPDLCIMFMVGAMIRGLYDLRSSVNDRRSGDRRKRSSSNKEEASSNNADEASKKKNKRHVKDRRSRNLIYNLWIVAEVCLLCFTIILRTALAGMDVRYTPVAIITLIIAIIYYGAVALYIVSHIKNVCYEYYIFMYNNSMRSGGINV
jgi:hypothetical protein